MRDAKTGRASSYRRYQPGLYNPDAYRSSDHDPVVEGMAEGVAAVGGEGVGTALDRTAFPVTALIALEGQYEDAD